MFAIYHELLYAKDLHVNAVDIGVVGFNAKWFEENDSCPKINGVAKCLVFFVIIRYDFTFQLYNINDWFLLYYLIGTKSLVNFLNNL